MTIHLAAIFGKKKIFRAIWGYHLQPWKLMVFQPITFVLDD